VSIGGGSLRERGEGAQVPSLEILNILWKFGKSMKTAEKPRKFTKIL
jgi:hypothetical protein